MHIETEGKLTLRLIPTSKGPYTGLVFKRQLTWSHLKMMLKQEKLHYTRMRRQRRQRWTACPRCWTWFVWSFIMFFWLLRPLHMNQMLFYHRPDPMLVLEINSIVEFVANYLYLVLGYLGKFLYYKALTGWPWENLLKKKIRVIFRSLWYY